jgi:hypothetical protein
MRLPSRVTQARSRGSDYVMGNPVKLETQSANFLVFIYGLALLLISCVIGLHCHGSHSIAIPAAISAAALFALHESLTVLGQSVRRQSGLGL